MTQSTKLKQSCCCLEVMLLCVFLQETVEGIETCPVSTWLRMLIWNWSSEFEVCWSLSWSWVFMILLWNVMGVHGRLREELWKLTTSRLKICCMKVHQKNALQTAVENQRCELKISTLVMSRGYIAFFSAMWGCPFMSFLLLGGKGNQWLSDSVLLG